MTVLVKIVLNGESSTSNVKFYKELSSQLVTNVLFFLKMEKLLSLLFILIGAISRIFRDCIG